MQAVSINTSCNHRACVLFIPDYCSTGNMLRISLLLCVVPTAFCIIVKDPPPSPSDYKYSYDVQDPTTGDRKSQHEVRQGDVVTGAYTVVGSDGIKRTVEYTADAKHGFSAVVSEEPPEVVTQPPVIQQPTITSFNYDFLKYHQTTARPYVPVLQIQPRINYVEEKPTVYFTPQNEIQPRWPINNGHYFIPARDDKY